MNKQNYVKVDMEAKVLPLIRKMEVGDVLAFPPQKCNSCRTAVSNISFEENRKFKLERDHELRLYFVERLA